MLRSRQREWRLRRLTLIPLAPRETLSNLQIAPPPHAANTLAASDPGLVAKVFPPTAFRTASPDPNGFAGRARPSFRRPAHQSKSESARRRVFAAPTVSIRWR